MLMNGFIKAAFILFWDTNCFCWGDTNGFCFEHELNKNCSELMRQLMGINGEPHVEV